MFVRFIIVGLLALPYATFAAPLSQSAAYEILKSHGFKWNMTKTQDSEAQAKLLEAKSELRPQIGIAFSQYAARINPVQFGSAEPETIDTVGFGTSAVELRWSILDSLADIKILGAQANERMTAAQTRQYQNELTALMLLQYLNTQRLAKQLEFMDANIEKSQLILKLATVRAKIGAGISLDVSRAKNLSQLDQIKKMATFTKYLKARHDLALLLGQESLDGDLSRLEAHPHQVADIKTALSKALENRQDLKVAEVQFQSAQEAQKQSQGYFFPKLELVSEVGSTTTTVLGMPPKTLNGFIGAVFTIPLESGGLLTAKRQETSALVTRASLNFDQIRNEATSQTKEALEQLMAAREALQVSKEYLRTAEEESQLAERKYQSGSIGIIELTSAHGGLAGARDTQVENVFNHEAARIAYYRAIGDFSEYFAMEKRTPE